MKISIIGGTGKLGFGLAKRFYQAGHEVMIGSRTAEKAACKVYEIREALFGVSGHIESGSVIDAAKWGDVVFITVPYQVQEETILNIKPLLFNKIVVDTTVPLDPKNPTAQLSLKSSVAENTKRILDDSVHLVSGFHTISHTVLDNLDKSIESDILLCGDSEDVVQTVSNLAIDIGGNPVYVGMLDVSQALERLTPMIIFMNKKYKKRHIGVKITGLNVL